LGDAAVVVIRQRNAGVASHTVPEVNPEPETRPASVAVGTVKNRTGSVVVEMAYPTKVLGKGLSPRLTPRIDASIVRGL
jgi:hypothetical protein